MLPRHTFLHQSAKRGRILVKGMCAKMREILFRGKRIDDKEWVIGSLSTEYIKECGCVMISPTSDTCYKVSPETVGQYTGLIDKNGKKIFESDIVSGYGFDEEDGYGVIKWNDGAFEIEGTSVIGTFHENYWGYELEVIGNVFDNPELLQAEAGNDEKKTKDL